MTGWDPRTIPGSDSPVSDSSAAGEHAQITEVLNLSRAAKCMLLVGGQVATLAVVTARLGQEEIRERHTVAQNVGRLFHACRQVRIALPELAMRTDELLQACCDAVEGIEENTYSATRKAMLHTVHSVSRRVRELAETVSQTCSALTPSTEARRNTVAGIVAATDSLGRVAGRMEKTMGLESTGLANPC
ncbi:MAG: hypothetical protein QMC81_04220 [Thermoanaerobacterales bacterium]|nr:hypothetical protein [Bacillota bacterium]MDI6906683.1 hypothetical protein [Thermoanaerobacterales bacterium]